MTDHDYELYKAARIVADTIFAKLPQYNGTTKAGEVSRDIWFEDRRKETVNPFYCQTNDGIMLELYYGIFGSIYTPWGKWGCFGSGAGDADVLVGDVLSEFGAVLFSPVRCNHWGESGPVYRLTKIGSIILPESSLKLDLKEYFDYETAMRIWSEMTERYNKETV